jgi:hypothetical protein
MCERHDTKEEEEEEEEIDVNANVGLKWRLS